jgi:hypothetical protein
MLDLLRQTFGQQWVTELAGILPLSALIDFVDVPTILHIFQLQGRVSLWCWPVTPTGRRVLLHTDPTATVCCLVNSNARTKPVCLDGRYGDMYPVANAETVRLYIEASLCIKLQLPASNVSSIKVLNESSRRPQHLEAILLGAKVP